MGADSLLGRGWAGHAGSAFGVPLFFIGFALITFPGKRADGRVLKGKAIAKDSRAFRRGVATVALPAPAVCMFYLNWKYRLPGHWDRSPARLS